MHKQTASLSHFLKPLWLQKIQDKYIMLNDCSSHFIVYFYKDCIQNFHFETLQGCAMNFSSSEGFSNATLMVLFSQLLLTDHRLTFSLSLYHVAFQSVQNASVSHHIVMNNANQSV